MAMSDAEIKEFNDYKAKAVKLDAEVKRADDAVASAKAANDELIAIKSAVVGEGGKADAVKAADVVTLVSAGKAWRDEMIKQIVTCKRHKKEIGDDGKEIKEYEDLYATYTIDMLKREHAAAIKNVPGAVSQLGGGDPNVGGGTKDTGTGRDRAASRKAMGLDSGKAA